jgi:hypothetical protein
MARGSAALGSLAVLSFGALGCRGVLMPGRVCVPHLQRVLLAVAREARFLGRQQVHFFV